MAYGMTANPGPMAGDEEMDSLYSEEGGKGEEDKESIDQEEQESMEQTAMVPLKVLQGKSTEPIKEGDEVVLKVLKVHDTQAEVAYSETPPGEIGKEGGAKAGAGEEDDYGKELDQMSAEG